jgi:hypothetical protein
MIKLLITMLLMLDTGSQLAAFCKLRVSLVRFVTLVKLLRHTQVTNSVFKAMLELPSIEVGIVFLVEAETGPYVIACPHHVPGLKVESFRLPLL